MNEMLWLGSISLDKLLDEMHKFWEFAILLFLECLVIFLSVFYVEFGSICGM
jgi:hypothetical protein